MNNPSKLIKFADMCSGAVRKRIPEYSSKFSRKDYTQWQLLTLLCVMKRYRLRVEIQGIVGNSAFIDTCISNVLK